MTHCPLETLRKPSWRSRSVRSLVVLAASLALSAVSGAQVIYTQPYDLTADGAYFSSTQAQCIQYDSFSTAANATVESVDWGGFDLNQLIPNSILNPTEFEVNFYSDLGGAPGGLLASDMMQNSGNASETNVVFEGLVNLYNFSGDLATPFQVKAGKTYWISIVDPTSNDDWFWATGSGGDGTHGASIGGTYGTYADDLEFTLNANAAPEPSQMAVFGLGLLGIGLARRRRSRRSTKNAFEN